MVLTRFTATAFVLDVRITVTYPDSFSFLIWCIIKVIRTAMDAKLYKDPEEEKKALALHPWGALGQPKNIAKAALFLTSEDASWVTGITFPVDGGYTAQQNSLTIRCAGSGEGMNTSELNSCSSASCFCHLIKAAF